MTVVYGIKNCDTMKKAFQWLEKHEIDFSFHDYKKEGAPLDVLEQAIKEHGWETVINKRGTTWRKLPDGVKEGMGDGDAIKIALENASIIKRPLLVHNHKTYLGFKEEIYQEIFSGKIG